MSPHSPPLPPAELRQRWNAPLDDDEFRASAMAEVDVLEERGRLTSGTTLMEIGCGPGRLAIGIGLRLGGIRHYTGLDADPAAIGWCRDHLGAPNLEFVLQRAVGADTGHITLEQDRLYDLISVRSSSPTSPPAAVSELLRSLRHHVADAGSILVASLGSVVASDDFVARARRAGLVVVAASEPDADGMRIIELSPGVGTARRSSRPLAETSRQRRTIADLERRLEALSVESRSSADVAERQLAELRAKVAERDGVVRDLRTRLKAMRSTERRQRSRIEHLEAELAEARTVLSRRLVRVVARTGPPARAAAARRPSPRPEPTPNPRDASARPGSEADSVATSERRPMTIDPANVVFYSAIVGDHGVLPDVSRHADTRSRFVCFSAVIPPDPKGWEIHPAAYYCVDPERVALFYKTHPHLVFGNRDTSVWVDGSVTWSRSPLEILTDLGAWDGDVVALRRLDVTLATAAEDVVKRGLDSVPLVEAQVARYRRAGYPVDAHLHDTSILVRRHGAGGVVELDEAWWAELERGSRRDLLSFDFAAWTLGVDVGTLDAPSDGATPIDGITVTRRGERRYRRPRSTPEAVIERTSWNLRADPATPVSTSHDGEPIDVVVPVHDALPEVQRCVRSVLDDPGFRGRLLLVDDGSQRATRQWCEEFARDQGEVVLVRHDESLGFSAACNAGIERASSDVFVLLNSDTVVPTNWSRKLASRLRSHDGIGLIGPLSNAASWQSIPTIRDPDGGLAVNGLPPRCSIEDVNEFLELLCADVVTPLVGTLNGFCVMIRRDVVESAGALDAAAFPVGYGEEVDLTMRATDAGFLCAVAPDTYVYHSKSRSFGSTRRTDLKASGQAVLGERYGAERLDRVAVSTRNHPVLEFVRAAFDELYAPDVGAIDSVAGRAPL